MCVNVCTGNNTVTHTTYANQKHFLSVTDFPLLPRCGLPPFIWGTKQDRERKKWIHRELSPEPAVLSSMKLIDLVFQPTTLLYLNQAVGRRRLFSWRNWVNTTCQASNKKKMRIGYFLLASSPIQKVIICECSLHSVFSLPLSGQKIDYCKFHDKHNLSVILSWKIIILVINKQKKKRGGMSVVSNIHASCMPCFLKQLPTNNNCWQLTDNQHINITAQQIGLYM